MYINFYIEEWCSDDLRQCNVPEIARTESFECWIKSCAEKCAEQYFGDCSDEMPSGVTVVICDSKTESVVKTWVEPEFIVNYHGGFPELTKADVDPDKIGEKYCNEIGCTACIGTGEDGEPNGYGCERMEKHVEEELQMNRTDYFLGVKL